MSPLEQPGNLVVLCTRSVHDSLRANPAALAVGSLDDAGGVEFLLDETLDRADDFRAAEMLSRIQPKIACRVEVLGDDRSLEDVERWVDTFRVRIQNGLAETRSNEFRLVLVICWLDPASQEDLSRLEAFSRNEGGLVVKVRDSRLVRRIYALDGRLNDAPGVGSGLFSARDCWAVAVDRLLMRLRVSSVEAAISRSEAPLKAWRFAEIAAPWTIPACDAIRREVWRRHWLAMVEDWPPPISLLQSAAEPPPIEAAPPSLPRFSHAEVAAFRQEVERSLTGSSRVQSLLESSAEGVGAMSPLEMASRRVSARTWTDVRARRERLELLKNAKAVPRGGRESLARNQIKWISEYLDQSDRFERASADLEEAADELDLARQTWVNWMLRIAGGMTIALVIVYAVYGLVRPVSGSALLALGSTTFIVAAIATAAGAVAGAMLPWWLELAQGNAARAALTEEVDQASKQLHELATTLRNGVEAASRLRLATWEENLAARLRRLGARSEQLRLIASKVAEPKPAAADPRSTTMLAAARITLPDQALAGIEADDFIVAGKSRLDEELSATWDRLLGEEDRRNEGLVRTAAVPRLSRAMLDARHAAEREIASDLFRRKLEGVDAIHAASSSLTRRLDWIGDTRKPLLSVQLGVTDAGLDRQDHVASETSGLLLDSDRFRALMHASWPIDSGGTISSAEPWPADSPVETVGLFVEECVVKVTRVFDEDLEDGDLNRRRSQDSRLKWILGEDPS